MVMGGVLAVPVQPRHRRWLQHDGRSSMEAMVVVARRYAHWGILQKFKEMAKTPQELALCVVVFSTCGWQEDKMRRLTLQGLIPGRKSSSAATGVMPTNFLRTGRASSSAPYPSSRQRTRPLSCWRTFLSRYRYTNRSTSQKLTLKK